MTGDDRPVAYQIQVRMTTRWPTGMPDGEARDLLDERLREALEEYGFDVVSVQFHDVGTHQVLYGVKRPRCAYCGSDEPGFHHNDDQGGTHD